mmetsp:Transcript_38346/g.51952  ORF Transcript_38346/g.51952 Transcript_38346/m.51952 type:complete len:223 (-) Transcript_38346:386-1054(-)
MTWRASPQFRDGPPPPLPCAELESSSAPDSIPRVTSDPSVDLSFFNTFRDTASLVFTKSYGFRLSSVDYTEVCERIPVFEVDFTRNGVGDLPVEKRFLIQAKTSGIVHAVCASWEVDCGKSVMATHPDATRGNFPRDMQWGQALQLLEDYSNNAGGTGHPRPLVVEAGEWLTLVVRYSTDGVTMQFQVERVTEEAALGTNGGLGSSVEGPTQEDPLSGGHAR